MVDAKNLKKAVDRLVAEGESVLETAMWISDEATTAEMTEEEIAEDVNHNYHKWYSQAQVLVSAYLPERQAEFEALHAGDKHSIGLARRARNFHIKIGDNPREFPIQEFRSSMMTQIGIVRSIPGVAELRRLNIKQLLAAELIGDELEAARHLLENGFVRAAGVVAGVALERHLKTMCEKRKIITSNRETVGTLNNRLKECYEDPTNYKKVGWMAELRATCSHEKGKEPNERQVTELIGAVYKFVSTAT